MAEKLPILIIVPHGGNKVPSELLGHEAVNEFDLFIQSDTCANELFAFDKNILAKIDTNISSLFIDLDRPFNAIPPGNHDGVMKLTTFNEKKIFREKTLPDDLAISNMVKRYYLPFHETIEKIIKTGDVRLILECHTFMAVAPRTARDAGAPRPVILLENQATYNNETVNTCDDPLTLNLLDTLRKAFSNENESIIEKCLLSKYPSKGHILNTYGPGNIPMIRLSLSKALFLNDDYFSYDYLRVDEIRIMQLKEKLWSAIERFYRKNF